MPDPLKPRIKYLKRPAPVRAHTGPGAPNGAAPTGTSGPVSGAEAYVAHQLSGLTVAPSGTAYGTGQRHPGIIKNETHDADNGRSGLTTGHLSDRPTRAGGYANMSGKEAEGFRQQFMGDYGKLSPEAQARWQPADAGAGQPAASDTSTASSEAADSAPPTAAAPGGITRSSPAAFAQSQRQAALPQYGLQSTTSTDASGTQQVSLANGGSATLPASQPQTPPDGSFGATNGASTGIYLNGAEQVKQPDGNFAPGQTSLSMSAGVTPAASPAPDLLSAAASAGSGGEDGAPEAMTGSQMDSSDAGLLNDEGGQGVQQGVQQGIQQGSAKAYFPLKRPASFSSSSSGGSSA